MSRYTWHVVLRVKLGSQYTNYQVDLRQVALSVTLFTIYEAQPWMSYRRKHVADIPQLQIIRALSKKQSGMHVSHASNSTVIGQLPGVISDLTLRKRPV